MPNKIIMVRGVGEPLKDNQTLLYKVTKNFPDNEIVNIPWSGTFGPVGGSLKAPSFKNSLHNGMYLLQKELDKAQQLF